MARATPQTGSLSRPLRTTCTVRIRTISGRRGCDSVSGPAYKRNCERTTKKTNPTKMLSKESLSVTVLLRESGDPLYNFDSVTSCTVCPIMSGFYSFLSSALVRRHLKQMHQPSDISTSVQAIYCISHPIIQPSPAPGAVQEIHPLLSALSRALHRTLLS